jgi:hypothetical protein
MFRFFEAGIDPFRDHDPSMPPASLVGYYGRYCRQVWPFLAALMAIGLVVALIEVTILRFVGAIVDILRRRPRTSCSQLMGSSSWPWRSWSSSVARWRASPMTSSSSRRSPPE